jgi:hypothetical protein
MERRMNKASRERSSHHVYCLYDSIAPELWSLQGRNKWLLLLRAVTTLPALNGADKSVRRLIETLHRRGFPKVTIGSPAWF